ncbi:ABC transporter ATP-binding protein [Priestia megaterium]|uniref:ABC transporter ATP-binding protein n=1 Tax=Priestia megaterium TaxID=1404 RepID=UPI0035A8322A
MSIVLEGKNVTKTFGSRGNVYEALKGIDFTIEEREFVGIMGPSGAGKTTLMNILSTIDRPTDGEIWIQGENVALMKDKKLSAFRRNHLGFIFQDYNLLDTLTVKENILLPLTVTKMSKKEMEAKLKDTATRLGIYELADKYPYEISGGQKQRVAAARAMITNPAVIFADEPTGALDSKAASSLLEKLSQLNQEDRATIIMVTHDPLASSYCSRVLFIKDGQIYTELFKGEQTRQAFFKRIMNIQGALGGEGYDRI